MSLISKQVSLIILLISIDLLEELASANGSLKNNLNTAEIGEKIKFRLFL